MNTLNYANKAIKQLKKIPQNEGLAIRQACGDLVNMPHCLNIKALKNHEYEYRLRIGNYRVFFNFDGAVRIVSIEEVKKRDERTY